MQFLMDLFYLNKAMEREELVAIAWGIWRKRCDTIHKEGSVVKKMKAISCHEVRWAVEMVSKFKELRGKEVSNIASSAFKNVRENMIRNKLDALIFVDASFNEGQQKGGIGIVIVNDGGEVVDIIASTIEQTQSPLESELVAILWGIEQGRKRGIKRAIILTDCLEIVNAVESNERFVNRGGYTLEKIKEELQKCEMGKLIHVNRCYNEVAHLVAKEAMPPAGPLEWTSKKVKEMIRELWYSE